LDNISEFNEGNGYQNKITLKHTVAGYKVDDKTISIFHLKSKTLFGIIN
jgi:hypothetical protein